MNADIAIQAATPEDVHEQIDSNSDATIDPVDDSEITADHLEALSGCALPNDEEIQWTDLNEDNRRKASPEQPRARRMCTHCQFTQVHRSSPEEAGLWKGHKGIASRIGDALFLLKNLNLTSIHKTLRVMKMCEAK